MNNSMHSALASVTLSTVSRIAVFAALMIAVPMTGCASKPMARETGFLADYSLLKKETDSRSRFASHDLAKYDAFIVDHVQIRTVGSSLTESETAEAATYFRDAFVNVIKGQNLKVVDRAGVGVARVRLALTDVASSTWWQKIHPASRAMGAGTGGAAMEGEVIDSVTGEQLAAVVQAGTGNQFNLTSFSTLDDVKGAIDKWAEQAATRLKELRASVR